jgi:hypothetical protein
MGSIQTCRMGGSWGDIKCTTARRDRRNREKKGGERNKRKLKDNESRKDKK